MSDSQRERLVRVLAAAAFLIFFQAYMVAPLLPHLAREFDVSPQTMGLVVPAYLIPYGIATLVYGLLSDHIGRRRLILGSLASFVVLAASTATARSVAALVAWRFLAGCGASAVVPLGLVVVGASFPYEQRGRPLGWLFGAMAGGMAFGSTFGAVLEPVIGWRGEFLGVAALGAVVLVVLVSNARLLGDAPSTAPPVREVLSGYAALLRSPRGRTTYAYVLLNSTFHSGVFTWLGLYLERRFALGEFGIGVALLGYGVPGFLFGPLIGRAADRFGRRRLIPFGMAIAALATAAMMTALPLVVVAAMVTLLSLGYDMTQPMFAGIVTSLGGQRPGQAMGVNVFALFVGFGLGSLIFGALIPLGFGVSLGAFATVELLAAFIARSLFSGEVAANAVKTGGSP